MESSLPIHTEHLTICNEDPLFLHGTPCLTMVSLEAASPSRQRRRDLAASAIEMSPQILAHDIDTGVVDIRDARLGAFPCPFSTCDTGLKPDTENVATVCMALYVSNYVTSCPRHGDIDEKWNDGFRRYLEKHDLKPNSNATYQDVLKTAFNMAIRQKIIARSSLMVFTVSSLMHDVRSLP